MYLPLSWTTQGLVLFDNSTRGELLLKEPDRKKKTTILHKILAQSYKGGPSLLLRKVSNHQILETRTATNKLFEQRFLFSCNQYLHTKSYKQHYLVSDLSPPHQI